MGGPASAPIAFAATAGLVGLLASERRRALMRAEDLTRDLRQTNAELARVNPLGTILTESTSPLTAAAGMAEAERRLRAIAGEAERLRVLVDDMLDLAVIEAGTLELHLEPVRLADAIEAAVERLRRFSPRRRVEWDEPAADVDVLVDWDRLGQIFDNLLANADRFGPAGTPIDVHTASVGPGLMSISVRDYGPGVAPALKPRLFERFVHGPAADDGREWAGTGLGLAIVKGLVEAHAGSVELEETNGQGASFRFTLPIAEEPSRR